ncbi:SAM-dependent methyltransferase [uncultured Treponema sp.]|uniref:class I SAM-dependent methyltransferase n=1 Tax=uncultured Treponema sp. TaxID=162155 RepID=UPI00261DE46A|nr:SAM-dependent methyltransferase [uncultured Treponema sp.]
MILSVTFSKPVKNISEILGEDYTRVKIKLLTASLAASKNENYFAEFYTQKQVFHKKMSEADLKEFVSTHAGTTFKNCVQRTESEEITILANKKGKITELRKNIRHELHELTRIKNDANGKSPASGESTDLHRFTQISNASEEKSPVSGEVGSPDRKSKNYLLQEGSPVPFLVHLGIMTAEGKVVKSKYDKFRQINRFLEMLDDVLGDVLKLRESEKNPLSENSPLSIVDFGSGKSYLTFAVQHYLTEVKKIPAQIFGLDLKKDVIAYCNTLAQKLELKNLSFAVGDIASFGEDRHPDIIVTLHACDTATDYALDYAIRQKAKAILSVPCCQHEINSQLAAKSVSEDSPFAPLLKYGLIKERFSALATDAIRADLLEQKGYKVQILEFIEESATPKNLLIRAVRTGKEKNGFKNQLMTELGLSQTLANQLKAER